MNIEALIKDMTMRPPMFIHPVNVYSIENFLRGHIGCAIGDIRKYEFDYKSDICVFRSFFDRWVYQWIRKNINKKYEPESLFWSDMLISVTKDADGAVELFFSLCEKFFEDFHSKGESFWEGLSF